MIQSVIIIGLILTAVMVILGIVLSKVSFTGNFTVYYPFAALFGIGLILLLFATIIEKVTILGAGLGGWGIASLFASAIGFVITSILDAYAHQA